LWFVYLPGFPYIAYTQTVQAARIRIFIGRAARAQRFRLGDLLALLVAAVILMLTVRGPCASTAEPRDMLIALASVIVSSGVTASSAHALSDYALNFLCGPICRRITAPSNRSTRRREPPGIGFNGKPVSVGRGLRTRGITADA